MLSKNIRFVCILLFLLLGNRGFLHGQPHNGEVYRQLLSEYFNNQVNVPKAVLGQIVEGWIPEYEVDSTSNIQLILSPGQVEYKKIEKKTYSRKVSVRLTRQDTTVSSLNKVFQDTLEQHVLKKIYKSSPEELKGDNPILMTRLGLPVMLIVGSIGGVITLFFARSR